MPSVDDYDFLDDIMVAAFYPVASPPKACAGVIDIDSLLDDVFGPDPLSGGQPHTDGTAAPCLEAAPAEVVSPTVDVAVTDPSEIPGVRGRPSVQSVIGAGPLDERSAKRVLRQLRDDIVGPSALEGGRDWDIDQSLLREAMIETLVTSRITEEDDWFNKVPIAFRQRTDAREKRQYLSLVLDVVSRISP